MHLVATKTQKRRNYAMLEKLQRQEPVEGRALLAEEMPGPLAASIGEDGLEHCGRTRASRCRVAARLTGRDFGDAIIVFFLVVLSTFRWSYPSCSPTTRRARCCGRADRRHVIYRGATLARYPVATPAQRPCVATLGALSWRRSWRSVDDRR
jgi:hypothetical protein